jgi:putative membrane protein
MLELNPKATAAIEQAIQKIESNTRAEVVVSIRGHSDEYAAVPWLVGCVSALAALAFMLFAETPFAWHWILVDPLVVGVVVGLTLGRSRFAKRRLSRQAQRRRAVEEGAKARFFARGVRMTRERTGVLVYLSALENEGVVLADAGIHAALDEAEFADATRPLIDAYRSADGYQALCTGLEHLGEVLGEVLPRGEGDVDELANEVSGE